MAPIASWFDDIADRIAPWCNGVFAYRGTAPVSVLEPGSRRVTICCRHGRRKERSALGVGPHSLHARGRPPLGHGPCAS